jgi:hypothetical protein
MRSHEVEVYVTVSAIAVLSLTLPAATAIAQAPAPAPAPAAQTAKPPSKPTPRLADGKPNLGLTPNARGYWGGGDGPLVQGANFGDLKAIPFQPWARALHEYRMKTLAKNDPYPACVPHGGPRQFAAAGGVQILQMHEVQRIYILSGGAARSWRVIYMDGRPLPDITKDEFNPVYMGHSVGRWEGDTLVVETTGFNEKEWLLGPTSTRCDTSRRSTIPAPIRGRGQGAGTFAGSRRTRKNTSARTTNATRKTWWATNRRECNHEDTKTRKNLRFLLRVFVFSWLACRT